MVVVLELDPETKKIGRAEVWKNVEPAARIWRLGPSTLESDTRIGACWEFVPTVDESNPHEATRLKSFK